MAKGEALDMAQAKPAIEFDGKIRGTDDFSEMESSDFVIVIAGRGRTLGMTRIDFMKVNAKVSCSVVKEVAHYTPDCKLMFVTNPVDIIFSCPKIIGFAS